MNQVIEKDLSESLEKVNLNKFRNKTVLIAGSNGLIGTYITLLLYFANKKQGLNIKVIGISKNEPNELLLAAKDDKNFTFYKKNLAQDFEVKERVDYIIHAATYAQPAKFLENKLETIKLNTIVTKKLLTICKKDNASFLFLSSSEIYGQAEEIPTPETYNGNCSTTSIRAPYSESKRLGETICSVFKEDGVDVKIARVSSAYGPGISIHDKRVLGNFLNKALTKKSIDLLDDGEQERTWLYISDCVAMLLNILLHGKSFIYNVGGEELVSIKRLAEVICELIGSEYSLPEKSKGVFMVSAPDRVKLDVSKVIDEFKFKDFVNLKEGLRRTIEWNKEFIKNHNVEVK